MNEILQYLASHGECIDAEIAAATGISLPKVRVHLTELATQRTIMACRSIKFEKGKKIESVICRLTGYVRPTTPARKPKVQKSA